MYQPPTSIASTPTVCLLLLFIFRLPPLSAAVACCVYIIRGKSERRKVFRDNFPWCRGERNSNKREKNETRVVLCAWCFPQIFTYPSSASVNSRFVVFPRICVQWSRLDDCLSLITMLLAVDKSHTSQLNLFWTGTSWRSLSSDIADKPSSNKISFYHRLLS